MSQPTTHPKVRSETSKPTGTNSSFLRINLQWSYTHPNRPSSTKVTCFSMEQACFSTAKSSGLHVHFAVVYDVTTSALIYFGVGNEQKKLARGNTASDYFCVPPPDISEYLAS
ncbi:hypothetical protein C6341_g8062 [Phytophthora cactorum]|nr:hypothetical protein C6341_g8062 [Phytophthora cactorum]